MTRGEIHLQLSVDYADDPKIIAAGEEAELLYVRACCLSKRILSDGFIADVQLARFGLPRVRSRVAALVKVGLWEKVDGGYRIVAYLKRNKSREQIMAERAEESDGGTWGNHVRWHVRRGVTAPDCRHCESGASQVGRSDPDRGGESGSRIPPESTETETETETETSSLPSRGNSRESQPEPAGGGIVDQALELAAKRYVEHQQAQGRQIENADHLARWWLQQNGEGARARVALLDENYDLTATQLADVLALPVIPAWVESHRRRPNLDPVEIPNPETVSAIQDGIRRRLRQPGAAP